MAITLETWLGPMQAEYLSTFIPAGGGAVRFVVGEDEAIAAARGALLEMGRAAGLHGVAIDTATTKLHMLHAVFHTMAASLDWEALVQARLERLVAEAGYAWPREGEAVGLAELADANGVAPPLFRATMQKEITRAVWDDRGLAQDFRKAMMALMYAALVEERDGLWQAVLAWLRGELRQLRLVREAQIGARIGRQNARAMLMSLCHWVRACGWPGLLVTLDVRQLLRERRELDSGHVYSPAAVMDCYEVIRQIIDDAEHFEGLFLAVLGGLRLIGDEVPKRSLSQYTALKMRVWDDVRPLGLDNPLAPLVVLA